jgi:TldD protein
MMASLFLEYTLSEAFSFDDNRLKPPASDTTHGFGLRAVNGEAVGFAHATDLSMDCAKPRCRQLSPVLSGHSGTWAGGPMAAGKAPLYG